MFRSKNKLNCVELKWKKWKQSLRWCDVIFMRPRNAFYHPCSYFHDSRFITDKSQFQMEWSTRRATHFPRQSSKNIKTNWNRDMNWPFKIFWLSFDFFSIPYLTVSNCIILSECDSSGINWIFILQAPCVNILAFDCSKVLSVAV